MSAVAIAARLLVTRHPKRDPAFGAIALIVNDLPEWKEYSIDYFYWHFGSLALFKFGGLSGP